jgi:hypothetical protein
MFTRNGTITWLPGREHHDMIQHPKVIALGEPTLAPLGFLRSIGKFAG